MKEDEEDKIVTIFLYVICSELAKQLNCSLDAMRPCLGSLYLNENIIKISKSNTSTKKKKKRFLFIYLAPSC